MRLTTGPARPAQDAPGAGELAVAQGSVEFDAVSYEYSAGAPVLKDVSFLCPGGQTLALVGATGARPWVCN